MLFDIGWTEMLLIGVVALVVIGPKDLPRAMRTAGFWMRKARTLSREFQSSIDQMIREAELEEVQKELKKATEFDIGKELQNTVDPTGSLAESLKAPDVPDYLDPAPGAGEPVGHTEAAAPAVTEPAALDEQLPLPGFETSSASLEPVASPADAATPAEPQLPLAKPNPAP